MNRMVDEGVIFVGSFSVLFILSMSCLIGEGESRSSSVSCNSHVSAGLCLSVNLFFPVNTFIIPSLGDVPYGL